MKTEDLNDELRPECDLTTLKVRRVGEARKLLNQIRLNSHLQQFFRV